MRVFEVILPAITSATAWATNSMDPSVLFVRVDQTLIPLYAKQNQPPAGPESFFYYGNPFNDPTEVTMMELGYIYAKDRTNEGYLWVGDDALEFGPNTPLVHMDYQNEDVGLLLEGVLFACKIDEDSEEYMIRKTVSGNDCINVDLYLLPYNKTTDSAVLDKPLPEKKLAKNSETSVSEERKNSLERSNAPWAFFVREKMIYKPLSGHRFQDFGIDRSVLGYGSQSTPVANFSMHDGYAVDRDFGGLGFVGFEDDALVYGPKVREVKLDLSDGSRVQNSQFYSCSSIANVQIILTRGDFEGCYEVEIYFEQYDVKTGLPYPTIWVFPENEYEKMM